MIFEFRIHWSVNRLVFVEFVLERYKDLILSCDAYCIGVFQLTLKQYKSPLNTFKAKFNGIDDTFL